MPEYILVRNRETNAWQHVPEDELPDEKTLQQLIREHPETLPLSDLGENVPPLLVIGREVAVDNGYVDVVAVDQDGLVTVFEVKLDRNPEVKRKVIGQVLGYGAYLWGWSYEQFEAEIVRKYFGSPQCPHGVLEGMTLVEAMEWFRQEQSTGGEWSPGDFRAAVTENLAAGRLRLMIVVDRVNDELQRTVEFLNNCTGPNFDILCAELRYFATDSAQLLVPTLIGKPSHLERRPKRGETRKWDAAQFFPALREGHGAVAERVARQLLDWVERNADEVHWGTGMRSGSFNAVICWNPDRVVNFLGVWTYASVEIEFQYARPYPPFDQVDKRREWLQRLNEIPGISLPDDSFNRRPGVTLSDLSNPEALRQFTDTMAWVADELRSGRDQV